jgi:hypothetical protein
MQIDVFVDAHGQVYTRAQTHIHDAHVGVSGDTHVDVDGCDGLSPGEYDGLALDEVSGNA